MNKRAAIVIRTLNEAKYLEELLLSIKKQDYSGGFEIVIVDSGSTDKTLEIASNYDCRITYIKKENFSFGRSLNIGCDFANADLLVFVSGHCIPTNKDWLSNLLEPINQGICKYTYGGQVGRDTTKYSEYQLLNKYFPEMSAVPQDGFFCNNANAAVAKDAWSKYKFDEDLTGCEDMYLAKQLVSDGENIGYVAEAAVYHIHDESWAQVRRRYEREAIALQKIMPEVNISFFDFLRFTGVSILKDLKAALKEGVLFKEFVGIWMFRVNQYWGAYKGNRYNRVLSSKAKEKYFYP